MITIKIIDMVVRTKISVLIIKIKKGLLLIPSFLCNYKYFIKKWKWKSKNYSEQLAT